METERDLEIRTALSKALGAPISWESEYGYSSKKSKQIIYTWDEILIEVGKALERGAVINQNNNLD